MGVVILREFEREDLLEPGQTGEDVVFGFAGRCRACEASGERSERSEAGEEEAERREAERREAERNRVGGAKVSEETKLEELKARARAREGTD